MFKKGKAVTESRVETTNEPRFSKRTKWIAAAAASIAVLVAGFFIWDHFWGPGSEPKMGIVPGVFITPPADGSGTTPSAVPYTTLNEGTFVYPGSDKKSTVTLYEPLPEKERKAVEEALAEIDFTSGNASSEAAEMLSDSINTSGKQFILIYPAVISCDGNNYFNGYIVKGSVTPPADDAEAKARCEASRTLDGARSLADELATADAYTKGTFEIFEVAIDDADSIYTSQKTTTSGTIPATTPTSAPPPPPLPETAPSDTESTTSTDDGYAGEF